jgi:glycosyltransferase involved in cell wall biosynthesis
LNIWLIQPGESLPLTENVKPMRTAFLAEELVRRGHTVVWWASAFDHFRKTWLFEDDAEVALGPRLSIIALKGRAYRSNVSLRRFLDHRIIARKFRMRAVLQPRPNVVVAATPPYDLAYEAVRYAKAGGIPCVVDIRDEWPDLFLSVLPKIARPAGRVLLARDFRMIRYALSNASGLVSMMDSLLDWGLGYAGRDRGPADRIFYLGAGKKAHPDDPSARSGAAADAAAVPEAVRAPAAARTSDLPKLEFLDSLGDKFIVTFVGTFVQNNDPSILIDCAKRLADLPIHFVLAGDGDLLPRVKRLAAGLSSVSFPGWLGEAEIDSLLARSHAGISPTPVVRDAFPNKVFAYAAAGLPVLTAFQGSLRDLLRRREFGFYFPPGDAGALAACIRNLYENKPLYAKMAANVRLVFDELFDADKIYKEYADYVERLA